MVKKIIFFIFIFYLLTLIQASFLVHFSVRGFVLNLVFITVILINLLNLPRWQKLSSVIMGGFFLDVFSLDNAIGFFGFYTLILVACYFLLKIVSEKYVRFSAF